MRDAIILDLKRQAIRLRLQSPAITAKGVHASIPGSTTAGAIVWEVDTGGIVVSGQCYKVKENLWYLKFTLKNNGNDTLVRFSYPYVFYDIEQEKSVRVFNPVFGGILETLTFGIDITYPGRASFCLTAASGLENTIATGLFNEEQWTTRIRHLPGGTKGQIRFGFDKLMLKKEQEVKLPIQFICTGEDWAEAMLPYKQWLEETFQPIDERPTWLVKERFSETRKAHCIAPFNPIDAATGVWIFDNEDELRSFEQIKSEIDVAIMDGMKHGYTPLFYQFGWWQSMKGIKGVFMFDSVCGDYVQAHELTKKAVDYIHEVGARVYLYTNAIAAGDETDIYMSQPDIFVRDEHGLPVYNGGLPMVLFCPGSPGMEEYWIQTLNYILRELDADGVFLDQICGAEPPPPCYDPTHKHEHPFTYGRDIIEMIKFVRAEAKRIKPDCYVGGELILDSRSIFLDETHGYGYSAPYSRPPEDLDMQRSTPPAEYYIFTRYLSPYSYTQIGKSEDDIINGCAGHYRDHVWRKYRQIFESGVIPCRVDPAGAVAYMFGPVEEKVVLAVRSHGNIGMVRVTLPDERIINVNADRKPKYIEMNA